MKTFKLTVQVAKDVESTKEYEIIKELDGNIRCTCEHSSLFPTAWKDGEKVCNHISLFTKLPQLFEEC